MTTYFPILIKLAIGLLALIIQINIMGKGNLAPTSALDQVQNYVLGGIIGAVIYSDTITIFQFTIVLIIWTMLVMSLKFAKQHNNLVKKLIDGQPRVVIERGQVRVDNVLRASMTADELMFKLRTQGIYKIADVKRAILEQNGQLTVIEFGDDSIKYPIIYDGQINVDVLEMVDKTEDWLNDQVKAQGYQHIGDIFIGEFIDGEVRLVAYHKTQS
ncbi:MULTISPECIES: DUF421 domain-containing protein [Leuconostoc]|uniref:Predicted membrane protein n=1 Tax=Leuconostoc citreum (strain KM20) TaxID=349519 RepID=B1MVK5_LEUCK|nr:MULTISPECIES: DUF421 domain-containing protein [Leuconostoc]ACA83259.1 Predicted membrane protein [Leuconostoc citreum KM20]MBA5938294.1 DUF421 domain-containing protein [Leuconostoc citreum]MCS8583617.1 DUF421 domain-containing protein [Leuconostoc citreum]MCS8600953.1 DUF421 domain-containing protein [Leuconostoc citreum]MCT3067915.1 DUF421 domain-containing protein [Leuconostoc citreum]